MRTVHDAKAMAKSVRAALAEKAIDISHSEALEIVAHGDAKTSRVVGRRVDEIDWPRGATVAAIVRHMDRPVIVGQTDEWTSITRHGEVVIAHHDTVIEPEDHVIVFCTDKKLVRKVEKLFQVGFHFL